MKKLVLENLEVKSFMTVLEGGDAHTVRGGESITGDGGCCITEWECMETRCMCDTM